MHLLLVHTKARSRADTGQASRHGVALGLSHADLACMPGTILMSDIQMSLAIETGDLHTCV